MKSITDEEKREELWKLAETFRTAKPEVLAEIVRQAESFLAEQLKAGLAADQRAINTAVALAAVQAAVVGGTATLVSVGKFVQWHWFSVGPLVACLTFALVFAVRAARPTPFSYSGTNPAKWIPDINEGRSLHDSVAGQVAIYAQGISANVKCLNEGHASLKFALRAAAAGVLIFTFVEFIVVCWLAAAGS